MELHEIIVHNYNCYEESVLKVKREGVLFAHNPIWDGVVNDPDDPTLWAERKEVMLDRIESRIKDGETCFVAVFVLKEISEEEAKGQMAAIEERKIGRAPKNNMN